MKILQNIIMVAAIAALCFTFGYTYGKLSTEKNALHETVENSHETKRGANDVATNEQNIKDDALNLALCILNIMRQRQGCDQAVP